MRSLLSNRTTILVLLTLALLASTGCEVKSWFDPSELGRIQHQSLAMPILDTLDPGIEEPRVEFLNATDPAPADLAVTNADYRIQRSDIVTVTISDLQGPGIESTYTRRVSESGRISLPFIRQVSALGLTEAELQDAVSQAYKEANIIQNPEVTATVAEARGRTFSVLGAVTRPGQYQIFQSDFRVLDALVLAGDVMNRGVTELYIIREAPAGGTSGSAPARRQGNRPATDPLAPQSRVTPGEPEKPVYLQSGDTGDGPAANTPESFQFRPSAAGRQRVIRVPVDQLKNGNLAFNVVIEPRDMILVPEGNGQGVYYMGGHVARPGVFSFLPGERVTLAQAIVAAGMLDPVAIPERTEIIRRIGADKQVFVRVNVAKIFEGTAPDLYLKPNDRIQVGTNALAPFVATLRNAFRFTYGFGFLYDRNFAAEENNEFNAN